MKGAERSCHKGATLSKASPLSRIQLSSFAGHIISPSCQVEMRRRRT